MKKLLLALMIAAIPLSGLAQANSITPGKDGHIAVASRGNDVRVVLHDLFTQVGKNYVLDPAIRFTLYLNLKDVEFDEALMVISRTAGLRHTVENGIFFITRATQTTPRPNTSGTDRQLDPKTVQPTARPVTPKPDPNKGTLPATVLQKRVTTRLDKVDLRDLMKELGKQAGLKIEVHETVPAYRIDAYLVNTSLKFALDQVTQAAGLRYRMTDRMSIEVVPAVTVTPTKPNGVKTESHEETKTGH